MFGTMPDYPLTLVPIFEQGSKIHGSSEVATWTGDGVHRASFCEVAARARQLAAALHRIGIRAGDRVGTLGWNTQQHLEAYFAVPCMGAVLHTLNFRLFPEQLSYIINHAGDRIVIVDGSVVPLLAKVAKDLKTVESYIVIGPEDGLPGEILRYEELLAAERPEYDWPVLDERSAAAMCYTTGTTGDPKGVAYSHRSTYLHSLGVCEPWAGGLTDHERILVIVPMFHANGWGMPYAGWMAGSDLLMPGRFLQAEPVCRMIETCRPTIAVAVPTVWTAVLHHAETNRVDFSSLRLVLCGGSAVPRRLTEQFLEKYGVRIVQGWGLTETSPLAAVAHPPRDCPASEEINWITKTGRVVPGVELRLCVGEQVLEWDGKSVGEIEVRGPWVTASYYGDPTPDKFHDGWLRTGDVGTVDERGYIHLTDRSKDIIKSGGEWISSVELEEAIIDHPDVLEVAVIGVPDERWDERPLACVVLKPGLKTTIDDLRAHLNERVAKWWIPDKWAFLEEVPKTSVGKSDKKVLRARHAKGEIEVKYNR
jgi:acyl-CoA synthetase (AMP-forming)/AMP-acid ligase II